MEVAELKSRMPSSIQMQDSPAAQSASSVHVSGISTSAKTPAVSDSAIKSTIDFIMVCVVRFFLFFFAWFSFRFLWSFSVSLQLLSTGVPIDTEAFGGVGGGDDRQKVSSGKVLLMGPPEGRVNLKLTNYSAQNHRMLIQHNLILDKGQVVDVLRFVPAQPVCCTSAHTRKLTHHKTGLCTSTRICLWLNFQLKWAVKACDVMSLLLFL